MRGAARARPMMDDNLAIKIMQMMLVLEASSDKEAVFRKFKL